MFADSAALKIRKWIVQFGSGPEDISCRRAADFSLRLEMESTQSRSPCRGFCSYFAVFVIFVYLGVNFNCSCTPQGWNCKLFLVLPLLITFVFLLWTDSSFQTTSRHLLLSSDWSFLTFSCRYIIRAAFVALLWVVCVLINGEWYVCCMSNQTTQAPLACKSAGMITEEEQKTIAELKNTSWVRTFILLHVSLNATENSFDLFCLSFRWSALVCSAASFQFQLCLPCWDGPNSQRGRERSSTTNWSCSRTKASWRRLWGIMPERSCPTRWRGESKMVDGRSAGMWPQCWSESLLEPQLLNINSRGRKGGDTPDRDPLY